MWLDSHFNIHNLLSLSNFEKGDVINLLSSYSYVINVYNIFTIDLYCKIKKTILWFITIHNKIRVVLFSHNFIIFSH